MTSKPTKPSPQAHLTRQLQFMRNSVESFERGHLEEVARMATVARVIIHQTRNSTSVLTQLAASNVPLLTTCRGLLKNPDGPNSCDGMRSFRYDGAAITTLGPAGLYYGPKLGSGSYAAELPAPDWWRQIIFALDSSAVFTRRAIVLGAANQDGGAHVDSVLDSSYERMAYTQEHGFLVGQSDTGEVRVPQYGYHVVALRQIAYELLNSPRLLALAESNLDA